MPLVPFGKYRRQPLAVLQQDPEYCAWLRGQAWVQQRYPQFHAIIVNNFAAPTETPEHNALQVRFLEESWCVQFFNAFFQQDELLLCFSTEVLKGTARVQFEEGGVDVWLAFLIWLFDGSDQRWKESPYAIQGRHVIPLTFAVELKPTLGDDYPAVLRQILSNTTAQKAARKVVVYDRYSAAGATIEQVQEIYKRSHVSLLSMAQIALAPDDQWPDMPLWTPVDVMGALF